MDKKKDNIFIAHVEKIVMVIFAVIAIWILLFKVVISPNKIEFEGKKFTPDKIDAYILKDAENLSNRLMDKPAAVQEYKPQADLYSKKYDSIFSEISQNWSIPFPSSVNTQSIKPKYSLPEIPELQDFYVGYMRAAAYIPTKPLDENTAYSSENSEPNDLDLVTAEASFDVSELLAAFEESFSGPEVKPEWKDKFYARPVIAAVELQRQELTADEEWGEWTEVPRAKTDKYAKTLEGIKNQNGQDSSVKVQMLRFDNKLLRKNILQPEPYEIASSEESWYPPSIHDSFVQYVKDMSLQSKIEKREELDKEKADAQTKRDRSRSAKKTEAPGLAAPPPPGVGGPPGGGAGGPPPPPAASSSAKPQSAKKGRAVVNKDRKKDKTKDKDDTKSAKKDLKVTLSEIDKELEKIVLKATDDINQYSDKINIWAYDDTVQPGKSYRYRMRIGVFNPIAGTDYYADSQESRKSDIILWSEYSEQTDELSVPQKVYFFPTDFQEAGKSVTVDVSTYKMGYWYLDTFRVHEGETIGMEKASKTVLKDKDKDKDKDKKTAADTTKPASKSAVKEVFTPETIDYSTGIVMVDAVAVGGWDIKNMKEYLYFDMLYSQDGQSMERIAAKQNMWSGDLLEKYAEIKKASREPHKPFKEWGSKGRKGGTGYTPAPGGYDIDQTGIPGAPPPPAGGPPPPPPPGG